MNDVPYIFDDTTQVFAKGETIVPEALVTMADALAAATSEVEPASPTVPETGLPPVEVEDASDGEQAPDLQVEQPTADENGFSDEQVQLAASLMDTTEGQNGSGSGLVPGSDDFWNHEVEVKTVAGPEMRTVRELTDGYLRQADYTQKTQSLAEQRKLMEVETEFYGEFRKDPHEFVRSLAVQAGLIEEGAIPIKQVEVAKIPTPEDFDALINERVEERVANDERVVAAGQVDARSQIDAEFNRLQTVFGIPIAEDLRMDLIREAQQKGTGNLEGLLASRLVQAQNKTSQAAAIGQAATSRPGAPPQGATASPEDRKVEKPSMAQAFKQAQVEAAAQQ